MSYDIDNCLTIVLHNAGNQHTQGANPNFELQFQYFNPLPS